MKNYYVYIIGNSRPTLYIGVTNNLVRRVYEHKNKLVEGFSKKYGLNLLLYFELFSSAEEAIKREKQLKHWNREWKLRLIKEGNPEFKDLYGQAI
ncbi:MAG: GIY-YIG nuclease family protein [bacterium]|nr:GIY-YIG nuclease family protein [bacterium]